MWLLLENICMFTQCSDEQLEGHCSCTYSELSIIEMLQMSDVRGLEWFGLPIHNAQSTHRIILVDTIAHQRNKVSDTHEVLRNTISTHQKIPYKIISYDKRTFLICPSMNP